MAILIAVILAQVQRRESPRYDHAKMLIVHREQSYVEQTYVKAQICVAKIAQSNICYICSRDFVKIWSKISAIHIYECFIMRLHHKQNQHLSFLLLCSNLTVSLQRADVFCYYNSCYLSNNTFRYIAQLMHFSARTQSRILIPF